jgi:hypothetical protein
MPFAFKSQQFGLGKTFIALLSERQRLVDRAARFIPLARAQERIGYEAEAIRHRKAGPGGAIRFESALEHEQAGFDRVLVPHHSTSPDATLTVAYAASVTERIHFMLAHRPGFVAPTLAARQFASLDQFSGGRLGVHYISGGSDEE